MTNIKKAELLSPCGNFDCVKAAVNNGADAVYLGGRLFNARAYASNFDDAELERVCDLCHSYQVKVYVTVNTLYKDEEFEALVPFIDGLYAMGVDGLIMQDLGAISLVRKYWPAFPVHASTQLTANSFDDVKAFEAMGLTTAVLSRELNLKEISHIAANTDLRIETFIHGALCVSYSGQCLMSSVLGNRSGNRGKCAQNCRLCYELLSGGQIEYQIIPQKGRVKAVRQQRPFLAAAHPENVLFLGELEVEGFLGDVRHRRAVAAHLEVHRVAECRAVRVGDRDLRGNITVRLFQRQAFTVRGRDLDLRYGDSKIGRAPV